MTKWYDQSALDALLKNAQLEVQLYQRLLTIQSLTVGLESLNPNFSVDLLYLDEVVRGGDTLFSRQVTLNLMDKPVIAAESLCSTESTFWRNYLNCGTASLGRRLFNGENKIERSAFCYAVIDYDALPPFTRQYCDDGSHSHQSMAVIARRSIFTFCNETLSLIEYYLPALNIFRKE